MKPRRSRFAFLLFAGPLSAALAFIWFISSFWWTTIPIHTRSHVYNIDFSIGCVWITDYAIWTGPLSPPPYYAREDFSTGPILDSGEYGWRAMPTFEWTGDVTTPPPPGSRLNVRWQLMVPLYPFFLALGIPSLLMLRTTLKRRREARQGKCNSCGYDLTGIAGPCPECGSATITPVQPQSPPTSAAEVPQAPQAPPESP